MVLIPLVLLIHHSMASPVPKIFSPEIGQLSFLELVQQAAHRTVELGFTRGILASLLVLGSLACALICVLSALAAYMQRRDIIIAGRVGYYYQESEQEEYLGGFPISASSKDMSQFKPLTQTRLSRYILSSSPSPTASPITKITIHASSSRGTRDTSLSSPLSSPLRSALSRSPPSRLKTGKLFFFGTRRRASPSSPKSVRWADEIQISVFTSVGMEVENGLEVDEFDIGTTTSDRMAESTTMNVTDERETLIKSRSRVSEPLTSSAT